MRNQLYLTIKEILDKNEKTALLLCDVGIYGFSDYIRKYPNRVFNIGVLEQATIGLAAGLARTNIIPFVHTFSTFLAEKSLEQIKVDFGYSGLNGNFIGMGAPYDFPQNGPTHESPGDVQVLSSIPNMQILLPGTSKEFDLLIKETYNNGYPTYSRVNTTVHTQKIDVKFGKGNIIKKGNKATIICFGNILDEVIKATENIDVTILYYSTVKPFDYEILLENFHKNIIICEPFYSGSINYEITKHLDKEYKITNLGIPHQYIHHYGTKEEVDEYLKLDYISLNKRIKKLIN